MSKLTFDLHQQSKSAFSFNVSSDGLISIDIQWRGGAKLSGFLFGPNSKVPYDKKTGSSPLTLSKHVTQAMMARKSMWVVQLFNPSDASVQVTLSVESPSVVELQSLSPHDQDVHQPAAVALLAHLLARYVNNAPIENRAEEALKQALDKIPDSRNILNRIVNVWRDIPAVRKQAIFGTEFGDLPVSAVIPEERLKLNLLKVTEVKLLKLTPGIYIRRGAKITPPPALTSPALSDVPLRHENAVMSLRSGGLGPTYRIDYAGLYCQQETEWDQSSNSDEPYVIFVTTDGFKTWSKRSDVYSDVDRGEPRGPSPALLSLFGEVGPEPARDIAVITTVMESDFGDPNHYREAIHTLVEAGRAVAMAFGIPVPEFVANLVVEGINWLLDTGDDRIGTEAVVIEGGAFHGWALSAPVSSVGLVYNFLSPVHYGGEWWNGAKYWVMYNIRYDPPYVSAQQWSDWEYLGGEYASAPTVASWAPNRLDVFVQGTNNHMMHKWWDGNQWSGWEDLGGELSEAPAAVSWGPNRIDCFVRGKDKQLWHKWWDGTQWSDWEYLGGEYASAPTVASWAPNRLDVFVQGTNNHMMHKWWDGNQWSGWEDLGGELSEAPAAVSWGPNRIDCFVRGKDKQLWHKWWDGTQWSDWEYLGGEYASAPTVASWAPNRLDVFVQGTNNHMMHKWWDGIQWSGWEDLGGELSKAPAAVSWGPNRIDCFVRGKDKQLWHKWTWLG